MHRWNWLLVLMVGLLIGAASPSPLRAETETIDLKALAKKARPAVMLLIVSDAAGKEIGTGTGFLVSSDGKLITNHHVIEGAASAVAKAENGGLFPVEGVLADDPKNDLVLLKLTGKDLAFLTLGNGQKLELGTHVAIIGSPLESNGMLSGVPAPNGILGTKSGAPARSGGTVLEGVITFDPSEFGSTIPELLRQVPWNLTICSDDSPSPSSSGSPVLDAKGEVVGVATWLYSSGNEAYLNSAVPTIYARNLLAKVQASTKLQPLRQFAGTGEDAIFSDPDLRAALAAEAAENYVEVLKRAKTLVARYPQNAWAHYALGIAYGRLNFSDEAIVAYRQALKLKPDFTTAWYNLGLVYAYYGTGETHNMDAAIKAYQQAIKLNPDYYKAYDDLQFAYRVRGQTAELVALWKERIKFKPDDANAWCDLGRAYFSDGRTSDAIAAHEQAVKLNREDDLLWRSLGNVYASAGHTNAAIAAFKEAMKLEAVKLKGAEYYTLVSLGRDCNDAGLYDEAIAALKQSIKLHPSGLAWYHLGESYRMSGRANEAIAAYKEAIRIMPDSIPASDAWRALGIVYRQAGRTDDPIAAYLQATKLKPDDANVWCDLGDVQFTDGHSEDAIAAYRQAIKLEPEYAKAWRKLGAAYSKSRRREDAVAAYREVVKLKPDDASAWFDLSTAYYMAGHADEGRDASERAKKLNPELFK